ncbi:glycerophosphoryl diester phosphodiesterase membrane domain-containing protein [Alteripontixanthobacter maritimus]|nr:glycerophosphoryl diester phosphodiesterase membrane domain-containing protein [Alteripontixanthobacter maritimus]
MEKTWSRALELVGANFGTLATIAGLFLFIPSLASVVFLPGMAELMAMEPGMTPEQITKAMEGKVGPLLATGAVMLVIQLFAYSAMTRLMGGGRPTVKDALLAGVAATLPMVGVLILFVIAVFSVIMVLSLIAAALGAGAAAGFLASVVMLAVMVWLAARLFVTMPVMVLENRLNPVAAIRRSWRLTKPKQGRIAAFLFMLAAAYIVISIVLLMVVGLMAAIAGDAIFLVAAIQGLLGALIGMVVCGLGVAAHEQLTGGTSRPADTSADVFG